MGGEKLWHQQILSTAEWLHVHTHIYRAAHLLQNKRESLSLLESSIPNLEPFKLYYST